MILINRIFTGMKYRHIFFDLDHTLWDFEANAKKTLKFLYEHFALNEKGVSPFDIFYERYLRHNEKLWERYRKGFIRSDELRWKRMWHTLLDDRIGDELLAHALAKEFLNQLPNRNILFPYTHEILQYLKEKNYSLHLITNGFDDVQWNKIKTSKIDQYFSQVVTSELTMSVKPNKAIFEYALNAANTSPEESIMIGDNIEADILGAQGVGMDQVFVNYLNVTPDITPTYTITHLKQLEEIL